MDVTRTPGPTLGPGCRRRAVDRMTLITRLPYAGTTTCRAHYPLRPTTEQRVDTGGRTVPLSRDTVRRIPTRYVERARAGFNSRFCWTGTSVWTNVGAATITRA